MEALRQAQCPHCGDPVAGSVDAFCCGGCELAWTIVHEAGLDAYYAKREVPGARPVELTRAWAAVQPRSLDDGTCELRLAVDGLRCSACTWVVESLLERTEGVQDATVSYASGRARIRFDPEVVDVPSLAQTIAHVGYQPRPVDAPPAPDDLLGRLGVAAFCTANLMLLTAGLYAGWADGMELRYQALFRWGALALATPIALYSAAPFFNGARRSLQAGTIGMDVPISLAVAVLYAHGIAQTLLGAEGYLDSLGMLVTLLIVGRVLEHRGRRAAADAAAAIAAELPVMARRRTPHGVEDVVVEALVPGDVVELTTGSEAPADGVVVDGQGALRMALLTGESAPVEVGAGEQVVAGATLVHGALGVRVERVGADTVAMRMAEAVHDATAQPLPPNPAEALAPWFTAVTVGLAACAGVGWTVAVDLATGIEVAVAVLVVACPCALGLSVPVAVSAGLAAIARRGVVFRDGASLLALADVRTLAVDKTGTVTEGVPAVLHADDAVLRQAAALERASQHPIARALLVEARHRGLVLPLPTEVREVPGVGVEGVVDGTRLWLESGGADRVVLRSATREVGTILLGDAPRPDAAEAVGILSRAGVGVTLLSGDHPHAAGEVGLALGVPALGGLTPEAKADWIRERVPVAFVGDGLNDGPALAAATVGIAMHTGVTSSVLVADGVVTRPALRPIVAAIAGARATQVAVRRNLTRALVYNTIAVGAALAGLINPLVAAVLMPLSSAWVVWGALSVDRELERLEAEWTSC